MELALLIAICAVTGLLAARKGYMFICWVLAGGILGLIILAFLPFVNEKSDVDDAAERKKLKSRGNAIGGTISAISLLAFLVVVAA